MVKNTYELKKSKPVFYSASACSKETIKAVSELLPIWVGRHIKSEERNSFLKKSNWDDVRLAMRFTFIDSLTVEKFQVIISRNRRNFLLYFVDYTNTQMFQYYPSIESLKWEFGFDNITIRIIQTHLK